MLTTMQKDCVSSVMRWYKGSSADYVLAGYAGTGKTFLIQFIMQELGLSWGQVEFATFTGKASLVLSRKMPADASVGTLHRLLYKATAMPGGGVAFLPRPEKDFKGMKLVVVDECSMVSQELRKQLARLERIGVKVLYVGDHGQLPPVGQVSDIYTRLVNSPDFVLTEIHRQAANNPIVHLSMLAREGKAIDTGMYGKNEVMVFPKHDSSHYWNSVMKADQVICGYNKTRSQLNHKMRQGLGFTGDVPVIGDKVICTQNKWDVDAGSVPLVNGLIGNVTATRPEMFDSRPGMVMNVKPDFQDAEFNNLAVLERCFTAVGKKEDSDYREFAEMDFGYAITCHKAQGSEWEKVFVYNEVLRREEHAKWLYTAITRAQKYLMIAL